MGVWCHGVGSHEDLKKVRFFLRPRQSGDLPFFDSPKTARPQPSLGGGRAANTGLLVVGAACLRPASASYCISDQVSRKFSKQTIGVLLHLADLTVPPHEPRCPGFVLLWGRVTAVRRALFTPATHTPAVTTTTTTHQEEGSARHPTHEERERERAVIRGSDEGEEERTQTSTTYTTPTCALLHDTVLLTKV